MCSLVGLESTLPLDSFLTLHLSFGNAGVHPCRLYSLFSDYEQGSTYERNPLFYEELDDHTAELIDAVAEERLAIAKLLGAKVTDQLKDDLNYLKTFYGPDILDYSNTATRFRTNTLLGGLRCPITATGHVSQPKFMPDFTNRYFTEDIPFGLVFLKGIAQLVGVDTPSMDKLIKWSQFHLRASYMNETDSTLIQDEQHLKKTCAPQRFKIDTFEKLKEFYGL